MGNQTCRLMPSIQCTSLPKEYLMIWPLLLIIYFLFKQKEPVMKEIWTQFAPLHIAGIPKNLLNTGNNIITFDVEGLGVRRLDQRGTAAPGTGRLACHFLSLANRYLRY